MLTTPHVIAHRGASAYAPDNTLEGVRLAAELGATMVEVDAQTTCDGDVVLIHDYAVRRRDGTTALVERTLAAETDLATLDELMRVCEECGLGLYLELKDAAASWKAADIIGRSGATIPVVYASFRPDWIANARAAAATPCQTAILFAAPSVDAVTLARSCGASIVHPCWENQDQPSRLLTPEWLRHVAEADLDVVTWHEERADELVVLSQLPLFGICTNTPDVLATMIDSAVTMRNYA